MKLQRYAVFDDDYRPDDDGEWCAAEAVEDLEAENEALRAEVEHLKAPPKALSAEEVTEPGWYWISLGGNDKAWIIVRVVRYGILDELHVMKSFGGYYPLKHLHGQQFIGPLTPPEV